jgi:hypothetical protein
MTIKGIPTRQRAREVGLERVGLSRVIRDSCDLIVAGSSLIDQRADAAPARVFDDLARRAVHLVVPRTARSGMDAGSARAVETST